MLQETNAFEWVNGLLSKSKRIATDESEDGKLEGDSTGHNCQ